MGFLRKILGPSFKELLERNLAAKRALTNKTPELPKETFQDMLSKWEPPIIIPPKKIGEFILNKKYVYKDVQLEEIPDNFQFSFDIPGKQVDLIPDSNNKNDPLAIMAYIDDKFIGYIPKNRLQSMIHDYKKREQPIYSVVSNITLKDNTELIERISIFLCFYYNPFKGVNDDEKLSTKLIKTSKKDFYDNNRQDNYLYIEKGDYVELEYDYESNSYIVSANDNEIGETNASVTRKLQEFDSDCDYVGIIDEITEDDATGKYGAKITIVMR